MAADHAEGVPEGMELVMNDRVWREVYQIKHRGDPKQDHPPLNPVGDTGEGSQGVNRLKRFGLHRVSSTENKRKPILAEDGHCAHHP